MISDEDFPEEEHWTEVGGEGQLNPYSMHKIVNQNTVEVLECISDEDRSPQRWVFIRDGEYEVWVKEKYKDEYGYELQPEEQVSESQLEGIKLKQGAMKNGEDVSVEEARELVYTGEPEQVGYALIALYYAAKSDPEIPDEDLDKIRETMTEHTGHVDTSHKPTVKRILGETLDEEEDTDDS